MNSLRSSAPQPEAWWQPRRSGDVLDIGVSQRQALGLQRLSPLTGKPALSRREAILLGAFALTLHVGALAWLASRPEPVLPEVPVQIPPMTIEFTSAAPPAVEPPPPAPAPPPVVKPPPPVVDELAVKPPPKPKPPKPQPPKHEAKPQPKPVEAPPPAAPAAAAPVAAAPPAPPVETPPSASADYLKNPAPEYPSLAQRRGWEGTVLLRVHVLADGKPSDIQIQRSSGRDALDNAAISAVKRWSFVPAKRGNEAIAGWVSVPLEFRLN